jgi:hypothetical protein
MSPPEVERGRGEPTAGARSRRVPRSRAGNNPAKSAVARNVLLADWHVLSGEQPFEVAPCPRRAGRHRGRGGARPPSPPSRQLPLLSGRLTAAWNLRRRGSSHKHCAMTRAPKEKGAPRSRQGASPLPNEQTPPGWRLKAVAMRFLGWPSPSLGCLEWPAAPVRCGRRRCAHHVPAIASRRGCRAKVRPAWFRGGSRQRPSARLRAAPAHPHATDPHCRSA